jgi:hypothetical protein
MENENIDWKAQNVWKKWAYVEKTLASMNIKKSGFVKLGENEYGNKNGYDYFQLQDFLPELIRDVCYEVGVVFYTSFEGEDGNTAVTTIVNTDKPEERIVVQSKMPATPSFENDKRYDYKSRSYIPLSGEQKAQKVIKLEGAKQTYFRRYNLVNALNLSETDAIEAESNEANSISDPNACGTEKAEEDVPYDDPAPAVVKVVKKPTPEQMAELRSLYSGCKKKGACSEIVNELNKGVVNLTYEQCGKFIRKMQEVLNEQNR